MISSWSLRARLSVLILITTGAMLTLGLFSIWHVKKTQVDGIEAMLKNVVTVAAASIEQKYDMHRSGRISEAEAKQLAMADIRKMRYANGDYVVITDTEAVTVAHPVAAVEGSNLWSKADSDGVYFARDLVSAARNGGGFVSYRFPRAGSETPLPKRSYAAMFQPWQWVVVTGVYVDDVDAAFWRNTEILAGIIAAVSALVAGFAYMISSQVSGAVNGFAQAMKQLAGGDTRIKVPGEGRTDEFGSMAQAMAVFRDNTCLLYTSRRG